MDQKTTLRSVVLASADAGLRTKLTEGLAGMRWSVLEAGGGAEAMARVEDARPEALLLDSWLPDLEVGEFALQMIRLYPGMDVLRLDGTQGVDGAAARSPRRNELLHALRLALDGVGFLAERAKHDASPDDMVSSNIVSSDAARGGQTGRQIGSRLELLPDLIGGGEAMQELARLVRLVAPRTATVLIEGDTGTGKELVAKAVHRLSARSAKAFAVLNCAAIPEQLLEAELFGHTRGAFTGAVQSRTGRIEAAHGGTLFLDEIGEMPLALQAKMLRFLESGELQRVGENDVVRVDVRVIAATHQHLEARADAGTFRLDLYHRLAVFPVAVPALRDRLEDVPLLVEYFLEQMGREMPRKSLAADALARLAQYHWPGNVRELKHVLERAAIMAADAPVISLGEIRLRGRG
jgi:DNA-binding NtrC family response regulator